jgi:hypothetical protein
MRNLLKNATLFTKIEFWAVTTIFGFLIFFFIIDGIDGPSSFDDSRYAARFEDAGIEFNFYKHYYFPQFIRNIWVYLSLVAFNFIIIPRIFTKESVLRNIGLLVLIFAATIVVFGVTGTYLHSYLYDTKGKDETDQSIFLERGVLDASLLLFVMTIYTTIKYGGIYLYNITEVIQAKYRFIRREAIVATALWLVGLLLLLIGNADNEMIIGYSIVIPSAIALYLYAFHKLIPLALARNKYRFFSYMLRSALISFVGFFCCFLIIHLAFW